MQSVYILFYLLLNYKLLQAPQRLLANQITSFVLVVNGTMYGIVEYATIAHTDQKAPSGMRIMDFYDTYHGFLHHMAEFNENGNNLSQSISYM